MPKDYARGFTVDFLERQEVKNISADAFGLYVIANGKADYFGIVNLYAVACCLMTKERTAAAVDALTAAGLVLMLDGGYYAITDWRVNNHFPISAKVTIPENAKGLYVMPDGRYTTQQADGLPLADYVKRWRDFPLIGIVRYFKQRFIIDELSDLFLRSPDALMLYVMAYTDKGYFGVVDLHYIARCLLGVRGRETASILCHNGLAQWCGGDMFLITDWRANNYFKIPYTAAMPTELDGVHMDENGRYTTEQIYGDAVEQLENERAGISADATEQEDGLSDAVEIFDDCGVILSKQDKKSIRHFSAVFPDFLTMAAEIAARTAKAQKAAMQRGKHFAGVWALVKQITADYFPDTALLA